MSEILDHLNGDREAQMPPPVAPEQNAGAEETDDAGEARIRIGDKEFKTQDEAFAYAQSLEQKSTLIEAQSNAYRQAIQDAALAQSAGNKVTQAPVEPEEDFDAKFYENPKEYLKEYGAKISAQTEAKILGQMQQRTEEEQLWGEFFSQNPELRDFKEDCEGVLTKHTDDIRAIHQTKGKKAAMDYLAQKTKAKFQQYMENANPKRELPRTASGASMGSAGNVTRNIKETQPVDFITEIRQARNKRG